MLFSACMSKLLHKTLRTPCVCLSERQKSRISLFCLYLEDITEIGK